MDFWRAGATLVQGQGLVVQEQLGRLQRRWIVTILGCELLSLHHNVLLIYPAVNTYVPGLCKIYLLFGREPTVLLKHTEDDI